MNKNKGFTLIEIIIGIVLISIALVGMTSFLVPQAQHSSKIVIGIKASEISHGIMQKILATGFDENIDRLNSGDKYCSNNLYDLDTNTLINCTDPNNYGLDAGENNIDDANDVDDFITVDNNGIAIFKDVSEILNTHDTNYNNFKYKVEIKLDEPDDFKVKKRIELTIKYTNIFETTFATYRYNF